MDGTTQLNAANLNPIISKINEVITKLNGSTPITVATPSISVSNGVVSIACATSGVSIYYTTNGSTPSASSSLYSGQFTPPSGTSTIKAIAIKSGVSSSVATSSYTPAPSPSVVNPPVISATWEGESMVTIIADESATIRYTTDGSTPSASNGTVYSEPFSTPSGVAKIKAVAIKGSTVSTVAETPTISVVEGLTVNNSNSKCMANENETTYYIPAQAGKKYTLVMHATSGYPRAAITSMTPAAGVPYYGRQAGGKSIHLFSAYVNSDGTGLTENLTQNPPVQTAIDLGAAPDNACFAISIPSTALSSVIFTVENL